MRPRQPGKGFFTALVRKKQNRAGTVRQLATIYPEFLELLTRQRNSAILGICKTVPENATCAGPHD
jgi:hypothetical protein